MPLNKRRTKKALIVTGFLIAAATAAALYDNLPTITASEDFEFEWILPQKYFGVKRSENGRIWAIKEDLSEIPFWDNETYDRGYLYALFDDKGNLIADNFRASEVSRFEGSFARFRKNAKDDFYGFVDLSGDVVIERAGYNEFPGGKGLVAKKDENGRYGLVDTKNKWVVPPEYKFIGEFSDGLFSVRKDNKSGFMDENGKIVIDFKFDVVSGRFFNGAALVKVNDLYGLIDKKGNYIIEPKFQDCYANSANLIAVEYNGKIGFIDRRSGRVVIDFKYYVYDDPENPAIKVKKVGSYEFDQGRALVFLNGSRPRRLKMAVIDESGEIIFRIPSGSKVIYIEFYHGDYLPVMMDKKYIIFDRNGKTYDLSRYVGTNCAIINDGDNFFKIQNRENGKRTPGTIGYFKFTPR
jgi:hypothetical protein